METIFEKRYIVQVSEIDFKQQLKLSSLFVYLEDMAIEHANRLGVGRDVLQSKYGVIWVLNRARVDIIRYPKFKEEIIIETWPEQPEKVEFNRNFIVYDIERNIIAKAFTQWVAIDFNTRCLRRSSIIEEKFPEIDRKRAIDCTLGKIKPVACLGPFLGSALMLAGSGKTVMQGVFYLFVFSMGLGVPYLLAAVFFTNIKGVFQWLKKHGRQIKTVSGFVLVLAGLMMLFDLFGYWAGLFA